MSTETPCIECGEMTLGHTYDTPETRRCRDCEIDHLSRSMHCIVCGRLTYMRRSFTSSKAMEEHAEGCSEAAEVLP